MLLNLRNLNKSHTTTDVEMSTNIRFMGKGKQPSSSDGTGMTGTTYTNTEMDHDLARSGRWNRDGPEELGNVDEERAVEGPMAL